MEEVIKDKDGNDRDIYPSSSDEEDYDENKHEIAICTPPPNPDHLDNIDPATTGGGRRRSKKSKKSKKAKKTKKSKKAKKTKKSRKH